MATPRATAELYRANQRRVLATLDEVHGEWSRVGDDLDGGWQRVGRRITLLTAAAMIGAARDGAGSVPAALAEQGVEVEPDAAVVPERFGATASDGRTLDGLLYGAVVASRSAQVASLTERLEVGRRWLTTAVHTQVVDASRLASQVSITAREGVGWVRMVNLPCCQDCAALAGKWYRHNQGFDRHPRCDCVHRPAHSSEGYEDYAETFSLDDITDLSSGQRKALEDGADFGRVVNRRTTRRRMATSGQTGRNRSMRPGSVDWIYENATDREHAMRLLQRHGFMRPGRGDAYGLDLAS